jgi:hypothetical protein
MKLELVARIQDGGDVVPGAALYNSFDAAEHSANLVSQPTNRAATIKISWEEEE